MDVTVMTGFTVCRFQGITATKWYFRPFWSPKKGVYECYFHKLGDSFLKTITSCQERLFKFNNIQFSGVLRHFQSNITKIGYFVHFWGPEIGDVPASGSAIKTKFSENSCQLSRKIVRID